MYAKNFPLRTITLTAHATKIVTGSLSFLDMFQDTCGSRGLLLWGQFIVLFEVGCAVQLEEGGSLRLFIVSAHPEQGF